MAAFFSLLFSSASAMFGGLPVPNVFLGLSPVVHIETSMYCTAVVLDSQTVLTAAHCTSDLQAVNYEITIVNPDTKASTHARITKVIRHPDYKAGFVNRPTLAKTYTDIAVVRFSRKISFDHRPAVLPREPMDLGKLSTWLIANGSTKRSQRSKNQSLPFSMQLNAFNSWITQSQLINSGPCAGDSGGGYFVLANSEAILVGIRSTRYGSYKCDDARNRGIAVDVQSNLGWISEALR